MFLNLRCPTEFPRSRPHTRSWILIWPRQDGCYNSPSSQVSAFILFEFFLMLFVCQSAFNIRKYLFKTTPPPLSPSPGCLCNANARAGRQDYRWWKEVCCLSLKSSRCSSSSWSLNFFNISQLKRIAPRLFERIPRQHQHTQLLISHCPQLFPPIHF